MLMMHMTQPLSPPAATPRAPEPETEPALAALVAIDWADEKHQVLLLPAGSQDEESSTLEHIDPPKLVAATAEGQLSGVRTSRAQCF